MAISFKLSRGKRFRPGPNDQEKVAARSSQRPEESSCADVGTASSTSSQCDVGITEKAVGLDDLFPDHKVSFTLNLFPEGYSIQRPTEEDNCRTLLQDVKSLHPYDKASDTLFSVIESGWLRGDILDDLPCKYLDGTLVCEVRDYRNCITEQGSSTSSPTIPILHKVQLRMSSENVVKDLPSIADDSWTYSNFLEAEAQILKAMQPRLCLDPTPALDRLHGDSTATKLNLCTRKKRRLQHIPELTTCNHKSAGNEICTESILEFANCEAGSTGTQLRNESLHVIENISMEHTLSGVPSVRPNILEQKTNIIPLSTHSRLEPVNIPTVSQDHASSPIDTSSGVINTSSSQNIVGSNYDTISSNLPISVMKRKPDTQLPPLGRRKRRKKKTTQLDSIQQQLQTGNQFLDLTGTGFQWRNQVWASKQVVMADQCSSASSGRREPAPVLKAAPNHQPGASLHFNPHDIRYGADEQTAKQELVRSKDSLQPLESTKTALDPQQSQAPPLLPSSSIRNHPPKRVPLHNVQLVSEDMQKDDAVKNRKSLSTQRTSSTPMVRSLVTTETSSGFVIGEFSCLAMAYPAVKKKDNLAAKTCNAVGKPNEPVHQQDHQTSGAMKCKPKSISMTGAPSNSQICTMETDPMGNLDILDRFVKVDQIAQRYQLIAKKNKVDNYHPAKELKQISTEKVASLLSDSWSSADFIDQIRPMSGSATHSKLSTYRARYMSFMRDKEIESQGSMRLMMVEVPDNGAVALKYECINDYDNHNYEIYLPTTYHADLLATQFAALMEQDGYQKTVDQIKPIQIDMAVSQSKSVPVFAKRSDRTPCDVQKSTTSATCQSQDVAASTYSGCPSRDPSNNAKMPTSANSSQALAKQSHFQDAVMPAKTQEFNQSLHQQQQQKQSQNNPSELHRQQKMIPSSTHMVNQLSHSMVQTSTLNMSANQMINNKPSSRQLQMLHLQPQKQEQLQLSREKTIGHYPTMNMAHVEHNMVNYTGEVHNMVNYTGVEHNMVNYTGGMHGQSSPMGPISFGHVDPRQHINLVSTSDIPSGLYPTSLSYAQVADAAIGKHQMVHERSGSYGQFWIAGMPELSSSSSLPMLGSANQPNMLSFGRNMMMPIDSKMPGPNMYTKFYQLQTEDRQQLRRQITCPTQQQMHCHKSSLLQHEMQYPNSLPQQQMQQQKMQQEIYLLHGTNTTADQLFIEPGNAALDRFPPSDNIKFFPPTATSMQRHINPHQMSNGLQ